MYFGQGDKMTLEEKAKQIAENMIAKGEDKNIMFSPMLILAIISILIQLFKLWKSCNKTPEHCMKDIDSSSFITRWIVRRTVRRELDDEEMDRRYTNRLANSIIDVGVKDVNEMKLLYSQV